MRCSVRTKTNDAGFIKERFESFEKRLRAALQHVDPPANFQCRVLALIKQEVRRTKQEASGAQVRRMMCLALLCLSWFGSAWAQTHKFIRGSVTAVSSELLTVRSDAGEIVEVQPNPELKVQKLVGGNMDLKTAVSAAFNDIAVGDRVLISATTAISGPSLASLIIVMKAADVEQIKAAASEDWRKRGIRGLVRSVDPTSNTIKISVASSDATKTVTIQVTDKTELMRYAPDSVKFSDAKPGPLAMIRNGDQLQARGVHSPDGQLITADEVVTGSFLNISGQILKIDVLNRSFTLRDNFNKATVTVAVTGNTDMRFLPLTVATKLATRLKDPTHVVSTSEQGRTSRSVSTDLTQMLDTMPQVTFAQLNPGDALMIAATASTTPSSITAITLLGGVAPLFTAGPNDAAMTLEPWSLSSGGVSQ